MVLTPMSRDHPTRGVLYPGSFDPIHLGHLDVIEQANELFGTVVVAIMHNPSKRTGLFPGEQRAELAGDAVRDLDGVSVELHTGLAVQAADRANVEFIVKGLRTAGDFEIEQQMAQNNHAVTGIRTVFLPCSPALGYISSRFVREIAKYGGDTGHLVPPTVAAALSTIFDDSDGN
jgi:pantetheine-phosphate adenylyltransferase